MDIHRTNTDPDLADLNSRDDPNTTAMWLTMESGDHAALAQDWCCDASLVTLAIEESAGDPVLSSSLFAYMPQESLS